MGDEIFQCGRRAGWVVCLAAVCVGVGVCGVVLGYGDAAVGQVGGVVPAGRVLDGRRADALLLMDRFCVGCHGPVESEAGLRLDELSADLSDDDVREVWELALDFVESEQMPPGKAELVPSDAERGRLVAALRGVVGEAAGVERAAAGGRTVLRRLNRMEYERTLCDLLGIDERLAELLPEDSLADGFDNVAAALRVSAVQMERYLEAADAALDAATVKGERPKTEVRRFDYRNLKGIRDQIEGGSFVRETEDAAVLSHTGYTPYDIRELWGSAPGRYKIRVSAYAHMTGGEPVVMRVYVGNFIANVGKSHLAGFWEVPAGEGTVVEFEDRFRVMHDTVKPVPYDTGTPWVNDGSIQSYDGPGLAVRWVEVEGPLYERWPPRGHALLWGGVDDLEKGTVEDARRLIGGFLPGAFRRPVEDAEVDRYVGLVERRMGEGVGFEHAMRFAYKTILCSPGFLYLDETYGGSGESGELGEHALANRLSYFLWGTMPDDELRGLADRGELRRAGVLGSQVERMLNDERAAAFVEGFVDQWLELREIDFTTPDEELYPEWDELLRYSMLRETYGFFGEMLRGDLGVEQFIDSGWAMLNERMARQYGIEGVKGLAMRRVELDEGSVRGGLMTQGGVLKVTANGTTTSPVVRGAWVLDRMLGEPAPPPPPNIPAVEPDIRGATTIRDQLAKHRADESCARCHDRIDPPGFALESFDVIGGWRDRYRAARQSTRDTTRVLANRQSHYMWLGKDVDPSGKTADGFAFEDVRGFKDWMMKRRDRVERNVAERLVLYATGAAVTEADHAAVDGLIEKLHEEGGGLRTLVHLIVASELFGHK